MLLTYTLDTTQSTAGVGWKYRNCGTEQAIAVLPMQRVRQRGPYAGPGGSNGVALPIARQARIIDEHSAERYLSL